MEGVASNGHPYSDPWIVGFAQRQIHQERYQRRNPERPPERLAQQEIPAHEPQRQCDDPNQQRLECDEGEHAAAVEVQRDGPLDRGLNHFTMSAQELQRRPVVELLPHQIRGPEQQCNQ